MNRHERRKQAALDRYFKQTDAYLQDHVRHLPETDEPIGPPGSVTHTVYEHDGWCKIYRGRECNCSPNIKRYIEPVRS